MSKQIRALLFGAGNRGADVYGEYASKYPDEIKFIGVAEPKLSRQRKFAEAHGIQDEYCFDTWEDAINKGKIADVVINCTQDGMHYDSGMAALKTGYDMLLEKPICNTLEETATLVREADKNQKYLQICHVLRYTDFFAKVNEIVRSGVLGQLITISHRENVSSWHMAHSFVRGNWRREDTSAPMILAKSCHDLDLLYWFVGKPAIRLSSFGSLMHFRKENAPENAPERCLDGCESADSCPFYAPRLYLELYPLKVALSHAKAGSMRMAGKLAISKPKLLGGAARVFPVLRGLTDYTGWPRSIISDDPGSYDSLLDALKNGPYGRCVYHCDNDVVDHQVVAMEFENGVTATFTMHGHSDEEGRTIRIDGSKASLFGKFGFNSAYIEIRDHRRNDASRLDIPNNAEKRGHGGGDFGIMKDFLGVMVGRQKPVVTARDSMESHLMAFAAEKARLEGKEIDFTAFRENWSK